MGTQHSLEEQLDLIEVNRSVLAVIGAGKKHTCPERVEEGDDSNPHMCLRSGCTCQTPHIDYQERQEKNCTEYVVSRNRLLNGLEKNN